ncbi:hypothetical protein AAFC00_006122 [Neodothiora populina]|uniref:Lytic polysaccharide monooxygenase n=1 Tax=Neodothiora populina TaxID=2781224 RepID=A0ABR3P435_9PEZI
MSSQTSLRTVLATCTILSLAPQALAHMEMSWPYPLHSKYDPANNYQNIDYSMTSPLVADGSNFPCKGYQNDRPINNVATWTAGTTYNMTLAGSAVHGGGSCQLSLSYDNGATFRVIQSMIGGCPLVDKYDFTLPSYVPNGQALFAWTWQNLQGNREFYMNCAEVKITGSTAGSANKRDASSGFSSFEDLPFIWKANLPGINDCTTTEGTTPVYPDPGPAVVYGSGASSSSSPTDNPGQCDAPTPFGQTYKYMSDSVNPATEVLSTGGGSNTGSAAPTSSLTRPTTTQPSTFITSSRPGSLSSTIRTSSVASAPSSSRPLSSSSNVGSSSSPSQAPSSTKPTTLSTSTSTRATAPASSSSKAASSVSTSPATTSVFTYSSVGAGRGDPTSTVTADETCPPDVTLTVYASAPVTSTVTRTAGASSSVTPSLTGSSVSTLLGFSTISSSTVVVVSAATSTSGKPAASAKPTSSATTSSAGPEITEGYATGDLATYLPCVPGTFICTSETTWVTCDQTMYSDGSTAWVYEESRVVAAGTECFPNTSPYSSSTKQYAQQADAPSGYYRDDRIAASQPYGSCTSDGAIQCSGSDQFLMCDHGGWVMMGSVAAGTTCSNDKIVATK